MCEGQNILSLDICSTAGSQVVSDLSEALEILRTGIEHVTSDRLALPPQQRWAKEATGFVERFPDFN